MLTERQARPHRALKTLVILRNKSFHVARFPDEIRNLQSLRVRKFPAFKLLGKMEKQITQR